MKYLTWRTKALFLLPLLLLPGFIRGCEKGTIPLFEKDPVQITVGGEDE